LGESNAHRIYTAGNKVYADLLCIDGQLYVVEGFPRNLDDAYSYFLVTMDSNVIFQNFPADSNINIFSGQMEELYGGNSGTHLEEALEEEIRTDAISGVFGNIESRDTSNRYIYYQDAYTDFIYICDLSFSRPLTSALLPTDSLTLVMLLLGLVLGLALSIATACAAYRPLRRLVTLTLDRDGSRQDKLQASRNEEDLSAENLRQHAHTI
jgi:hypothetical protein